MHNEWHWIHPPTAAKATYFLLASVLASLGATAQADPAKYDLTDDGNVNILDISAVASRFGLQAGQHGYREGLDLVPDGVIDMAEIMGVFGHFGSTGIATDPTTLRGRVFDGLGNPLPGVKVKVHQPNNGNGNGKKGTTDILGMYKITGLSKTGEKLVTFDGASAVDPTPDLLSGQYPTIPNKPIFINGGIQNVFRDIPLPERDLTGAVDLRDGGATKVGGKWKKNKAISLKNAGVKLEIPAGCTATFPDGEDPVLSITRVAPDRLPVPMPPGLSSSIFVTYQPGSTEINCPGAGPGLSTTFDNSDAYVAGNSPFLAGITNGVFTELVDCDVNTMTDQLNCGPIPTPFDFAWYHVDILNPVCPRTTALGSVVIGGDPVAGATVSLPGMPPVQTGNDGIFSIPNVPAGPNGSGCFANPFSLRASAIRGGDSGVSGITPSVPGGSTDLGTIHFGISGTVQGRAKKLVSVSPFKVNGLPKARVRVDPVAFPECCTSTDGAGNYNVQPVPPGDYFVDASFFGEVTEPDGDRAFNGYRGFQTGNIGFDGAVSVHDFRFTGTGAVQVTLRDVAGAPLNDAFVTLAARGGPLGQGFESAPAQCVGISDAAGEVTLSSENFSCFSQSGGGVPVRGVPQGPCEITVMDSSQNLIATLGPEQGCFLNQMGELLELDVQIDPD